MEAGTLKTVPSNYRIFMNDEPLDVADNHFDSYAEALRVLDRLNRADSEASPIVNGSYISVHPLHPTELSATIHIDTTEPS